jgi:hypothetical protein
VPGGQWGATHLQAALFLKKVLPPQVDIFSPLIGAAPDSQEDRPKEGMRVQTGSQGENRICQVIIAPARVDIYLIPVMGADVLTEGAPILGDFREEAEKFAATIEKWLPQCDFPVLRIAMVGRALAPADTAVDAYKILESNLKSVRVRPGEMRDISFRVNWPATTDKVPEGYLNRLTTWTALKIGARLGVVAGPQFASIEKHYAQREIDVNTPAEHAEELPQSQLAPIFNELFQLVIRTAEAGESP